VRSEKWKVRSEKWKQQSCKRAGTRRGIPIKPSEWPARNDSTLGSAMTERDVRDDRPVIPFSNPASIWARVFVVSYRIKDTVMGRHDGR
jgi:hypothetical protein